MAPTNRLTNGSFDSGSTGWTTDDPVSDGTRTYTFAGGALMTVGTGTGAITQQIAVTAGEELWITIRGCGNATGIALAVGIRNGATYRYATDGAHVAPLDWDWPIRSEWRGWRVVVPAGWTTAKVFVKLAPGTVWIQELGCYTSPDLVVDGDFSTNTDGTTGGDGGAPSGWTLDWHQLTGSPGGWATYGGALKHTGTDTSGCASKAFAVTAGERLWVSARGWGGVAAAARIRVYYGAGSTFAVGAATGYDELLAAGDFPTAADTWEQGQWDGFVAVQATGYARVVVYGAAAGTYYWDKVSARRVSTVTAPNVRVEVNLGGLSGFLERPGYGGNWIVGDTGGYNLVGTTFLSTWSGGGLDGIAWTDISQWVRSVSINRGRRSLTDDYETGSASLELDNLDRRFDPMWVSDDNPYARAGVSYVRSGRPIRVALCDPDTTEPNYIFTGRSTRWQPSWALSAAVVAVTASEATRGLTNPVLETTFASQRSDQLLRDLLDAVGWPESLRAIDTGTVTCPEITESGSLLGFMRGCALVEHGRFYVDGASRARLRVGATWRTTEVQGLIDPASTVGAWGLDPEDVKVEYDQTLLRNRVAATRYGGTTADSQVASDDDSRDQYDTSSYEVTDLLVGTNAEAAAWTEVVLAANSSPVARIDSVDIAPHINEAWWAYLLWSDFGDRFTARAYPPPYGTDVIEQDVQFEAIRLELRFPIWAAHLGFVPVTT